MSLQEIDHMRYKIVVLVVVTPLLWGSPIFGGEPSGLHVHLPRAVRMKGKEIRLGGLCIIRGADAKLVAKASNIAMGRTPWSREKIVIDHRTILSRLAASGISAKDVRLTGAAKATVTRDEVVFDAERLVRTAEAFLKKARPSQDQSQWRLLRKPEALLVPEADDIQLKPRLGSLSEGYVYVEIAAVSGERELGVARVPFKQLYSMRQLVAVRNIPSGGVITADNTKITVVSISRKPSEWKSPYGMICSQSVRAGGVIRPSLWKSRKPIVVVRRNKGVQMKIQMPGFIIVATGQALEDGRVGELIKVRNTDSKRIIMARVGADGTVTPVYNDKR